MTNEERRKTAEWFRNRAKNCPMPGAKRMYEIATEALEEREGNEQPTIEPPTTTWLNPYCPYTCQHCGYHVDSKTRYCPDCGRRASNYEV